MDPQEKQAWASSLRLLASTPKSRKELETKLSDKGYASEVVQKTLNELEEKGFLSDEIYAQNLVSRFTQGSPSGRRKIAFELKRHGIPNKLREGILEALDPEAEIERAREIGFARWQRLEKLEPQKRKKRVFDFLIRRGFEFGAIQNLIHEFERLSENNES